MRGCGRAGCVRSVDYARTPPRAPKAVVVFVVRFVVMNMAATYGGEFGRRQRLFATIWRRTRLNPSAA
ncbi:hypothetical protein C2U70_08155 [Bradyrhizobium guangdongense]|nr:hypothetical protein C2U70_08155 [Bradyrhizobium guangdongense]